LSTSWTVRTIVHHLHYAEIDALIKKKEPGCSAGDRNYIPLFQKCWSEVTANIGKKKTQEYEQLAAKWNKEGADAGVKAKWVLSSVNIIS